MSALTHRNPEPPAEFAKACPLRGLSASDAQLSRWLLLNFGRVMVVDQGDDVP